MNQRSVKNQKTIAQQWEEALKHEGYEHAISNENECKKLKRFSRVWRRILRHLPVTVKSAQDRSVFEFGCGGGKHLAQFIMNGWKGAGIDVSPEVLDRTRRYLEEVKRVCGCKGEVKLIGGDFLEYNGTGAYDVVFHVGVLEHFIDDRGREQALKKMFEITKPGGYVVSIVPSGMHPLRKKVRERGLGGYGIPEIDYTNEIMESEMEKFGGKNIKILPHNIMGYLLIDDKKGAARIFNKLIYYIFQVIPLRVFPKEFLYKHGMTLIGIAQK